MKVLLARKNQNWMSKNSNRIFQDLIEFIKGLIARKLIFKVNLGCNLKKLNLGVGLQF
jgi:hypothetical protein